jgi:outer membrane protein assembly factor BamB
MRTWLWVTCCGLIAGLLAVPAAAAAPEAKVPAWPGFRGDGSSSTSAGNLPLEWSPAKGVAWQVELPGYGQSSPVIWGDTVFITAASGKMKETLIVAAYDLATGKQKWLKEFPAAAQIEATDYVSKAAPTPAVDAERVYAFFETGDLLALDHAGNQLWHRQLTKEYGEYKGNHGIGSSLALAKAGLIVLWDHEGPGFLIGVDKATGKNLWKVDRDARVSWSSPIIAPGEQEEVVISSKGVVQAYRTSDGKLVWEQTGLDGNTVASPTPTGELVVIGSNDAAWNVALKRGAEVQDRIAWRAEATNSFGSPLVHRGKVYYVNRAGVATCIDLADGKTLWSQRLPGSCWASPLGAGDRVYFFTKDGKTVVISADETDGRRAKVLAENEPPVEGTVYGVAVVPGAIVLRTTGHLVKLAGE